MTEDGVVMEVLDLIEQSAYPITWYQVDRHLSIAGIRPSGGVIKLLNKLVADQLIREIPGPNPGQPAYELTERGRTVISG